MIRRLQNGCAVICMFFSTILFAQQQPIESRISGFAEINFTELTQKEQLQPSIVSSPRYIELRRELPNGMARNRAVTGDVNLTEINVPGETNASSQQPSLPSPAPLRSFTGIRDDRTVIPPDVMGAAGPNH